jgi:8-oxo-dGTP diphosphatase
MPFSKTVRVRVAGILIEDDRLLLIAHKKDGGIYWLLPGGGVKYGESLEQALAREFMEELNIGISVGPLAMVCDSIDPEGGRHVVNICFRCSHVSGEFRLGGEERLHDYSFFGADKLAGIPMYPPVNGPLFSIMNNTNKEIYLGKIWQDK